MHDPMSRAEKGKKEMKKIKASLLPNKTPEVTAKPQNDVLPFDFFSGAMKSYWASGHFSDLIISAKGYRIRVHKMVVCSQSVFLSFLVHIQDKNAKTIKVPDNVVPNFNLFKAMIAWMYGVEYMYPGIESKTYIHAGMYDLAICFNVARLRKHALKKIKESTEVPEAEWDTKAFLRLVNQEMGKGYHQCMHILLLDIRRKKIEVLLKEPELEHVLKNHRVFTRELLRSLGQAGPQVRCLECGGFCREGRCANEKCTCDEDWSVYFR
ncbi:hypothetical protein EYB26_006148 [Talaromyces marneffei]|uniref:uncharacterized protein n=1 Tax=Talaromyces marneffei TaxID=37727 RepID=UPI0012A7AEA3|nr:uncharacterized protein EYB26_006148 [Talaromyces marneffei]QGA18463.1 hypothetical protein EYB26_006148 [Talaromyces marneffei]